MQVSAPPRQFTGRIHLHAFRSAYQAEQRPLGQDHSTSYTSALGYMFGSFSRFDRHLNQSTRQPLTSASTKLFPFIKNSFIIAALVFLTGDDLAAIGIPPGPSMGALLKELLEA